MRRTWTIIWGLISVIGWMAAAAVTEPVATNSAPFLEPPPVDRQVLMVNGIMRLHDRPQVAFKVQDAAGEHSYVLNPGEEREGIRVQAIDEKTEAVTFNNHGRLQKIGIERTATNVGGAASTQAATNAVPEVVPPSAPLRRSQPDSGPGATVVVVGHRDPPARVNGITPLETAPGGGGGGFFPTDPNSTNSLSLMNSNRLVPVPHAGRSNLVIRAPAIISQPAAPNPSAPPAPPIPQAPPPPGR